MGLYIAVNIDQQELNLLLLNNSFLATVTLEQNTVPAFLTSLVLSRKLAKADLHYNTVAL